MPDFAFSGASSNVFAAGRYGKIKSSKDLSFCLQKVTIDDRQVPVNIFLVYHPDGRVHATVGQPVNTTPFIGPGMVTTPQLMFPMPKLAFSDSKLSVFLSLNLGGKAHVRIVPGSFKTILRALFETLNMFEIV